MNIFSNSLTFYAISVLSFQQFHFDSVSIKKIILWVKYKPHKPFRNETKMFRMCNEEIDGKLKQKQLNFKWKAHCLLFKETRFFF